MSTKQGYIKDFENNKMIPETTSAMVTDLAKNQALSQTLLDTPDKSALGYPAFSTVTDYEAGDIVYYANKLYQFTADHEAGAWTGEDVEDVSIKVLINAVNSELETKLTKGTYSADTAVGLADNIRGDVYADEQFAVRMTGGEANEVGGIGVVQQLKGAGAAIVQLFPEGSGHDFSGDVSLDGTGGNAEAPLDFPHTTSISLLVFGLYRQSARICLHHFFLNFFSLDTPEDPQMIPSIPSSYTK